MVWFIANNGIPEVFLVESDGLEADVLLTAISLELWDDHGCRVGFEVSVSLGLFILELNSISAVE